MSGQVATDYSELEKAIPFCPRKMAEVISRLVETGDIKQTAKDFGKSESYCKQAIYAAKRKLAASGNKKQKTLTAKLLNQAGIDPKWLAEQKRAVILQDKSPVAALKAIQDCEEVFGLRDVTSGIHIDTGPKLIINLGGQFDSLKHGGMQSDESVGYSPIASGLTDKPAPVRIDTQVAQTSVDGLLKTPSAKSEDESASIPVQPVHNSKT